MTNEDAIKKQVNLLRDGYNIGIYPNYIERYCNECDLENFLFACRNNLNYEQIHFTQLGINTPFHRASLIGFNNKSGTEWFIVDPTYEQFFENESFKYYMFKYHKDFSDILLNQGYIKCTLLNIISYLDGFLFSNAYTSDIDYNEVYKNVETLLLSNSIIKKDLYDLKKYLVDLLNIRAHILYNNISDIKCLKL